MLRQCIGSHYAILYPFNEHILKNDRANKVVNHTSRHTFATHLVMNHVSIFEVQKLMNHKDINQTLRYAKMIEDNKRVAINKLF